MNTISNLTDETIALIIESIQLELTKRGFHSPIGITQTLDRHGNARFEISSPPFQTIPVIFKTISISSRSGSTFYRKDDAEHLRFAIGVFVDYQHFGGGYNGCELFSYACIVSTEDNRIFREEVR